MIIKRRVSLCAWLVIAAILPTLAHAKSCDRVVSYFLSPYQGSQLKRNEWRIFDPARRKDALFLSSPVNFGGVRWDTTFSSVWFALGDSVCMAPWQLGSKPRYITKLPPGHGRWWFNPDSSCWQSLRVLGEPTSESPFDNRFPGELWQSSRDGRTWRRVRVDPVDQADPEGESWEWSDGSPMGKEGPAITLDDLASESWEESWNEKAAFIDTAAITVTRDDGNGYSSDQWFFLAMESLPRRGIAFQRSGPLAPEHAWSGVIDPLYFVDLDRRTKALICDTDGGIMRSLAAEHCGYLLIPGAMGSPLVIDSSGVRVFSQSWNSEGAVWVTRPRP